ncbi:MAG TPA: UvrD-helicase domain-containing protein [Miltoncostaeaceae bacterium]|nr:UvrD-helicase domain-containing protein [Miltoncostaeaceae bacterium]
MAVAPPTIEQEAALAAAATASATAVAAGAGAGKTTLLVEAVWRDVEDDGVPLDRILVASYNRAAAAHLVACLQERFADPDDGRGAARPGLDLSAAWVGTFHALAARIVREHPFAAGVDPDFGELDETEAASLMEQALDEAMEASMADPGFLDLVTDATSLAGVREATRHAHERLRAAGHEEPRIAVPDAPGPSTAQQAGLRALIGEVAAHRRARDDHRAQLQLASAMLDSGEAGAAAPRLAMNCAEELKPLCGRFNELAAEVFQALLDVEARAQLMGFAAHLEAFAGRYAELKRERGALDYEDLLLAARRVLRGAHGYRFARAYVDEFQDANALQAEIVDLLGAQRTVVVGDGCQAIYGFRHADVAHFMRRAGTPPAVTLRDNHRSQAPLLAALNGVLGAALADEPAFGPLRAAAPAAAGPPLARAPLEVVDVVSDDGERATREQEALVVADLVAGLGARGYRWPEIAVLFRSLTAVEPYRAALAAHGIPAHLVTGRGFFAHDQVADTLALLALVENPYDEAALVRVLGSPYASVSDRDLVDLRAAAPPAAAPARWPAAGALLPAARALDATRPVIEAVDGLRPLLRERGLAGLVEGAVAARGYDLAVLGLPDGARRHANLRKLVRMAAEHAAVRGPDLRGFLALLTRMAEADQQDPGEATLVDPDLDAVRLATIHAAKGQEYPAVVIADASHGLPSTYPAVLVDRDGGAGIRISRVGGGPTPALGYRARREAASAADAAEERRIVYVGATRAERHLAVVGRSTAGGRQADAAFRVLRDALGMAGPGESEYPRGGRVALTERPVPAAPAGAPRPRLSPVPPVAAEPPPPPSPRDADPVAARRLSFTALSTLATCARRFHLEHERGLRGRPEAVVPAPGERPPAPGGWGATALGDLVHRALAAVDWSGPGPAAGWADAAEREAGLPDSEPDRRRAERLVTAALGSRLAERIRAGRARAEEPFAIEVEGAVLGGAIDLLVDEGGGRALVVDWKTHALGPGVTAASVADEYRLQQALYGLAALRAGSTEVTLAWAVVEDLAASPTRTVGPADAAALEGELAVALAPLRRAERPSAARTAQPFCSGCPGLDAMCPVARTRG